jgi:hypothetical protein
MVTLDLQCSLYVSQVRRLLGDVPDDQGLSTAVSHLSSNQWVPRGLSLLIQSFGVRSWRPCTADI